jgi:hypothetical protein
VSVAVSTAPTPEIRTTTAMGTTTASAPQQQHQAQQPGSRNNNNNNNNNNKVKAIPSLHALPPRNTHTHRIEIEQKHIFSTEFTSKAKKRKRKPSP